MGGSDDSAAWLVCWPSMLAELDEELALVGWLEVAGAGSLEVGVDGGWLDGGPLEVAGLDGGSLDGG